MSLPTKDKIIEELWESFEDIPVNSNSEIEEDFDDWEQGTPREEIWTWFDNHHSKGVNFLLYGQ